MVPLINAGVFLSPLLIIGSVFDPSFILASIALVLLLLVVIFYLVTLPVEFDASRRALRLLKDKQYLNREELAKARKVLTAVALIYVAATLVVFVELFRFIIVGRRR